jgi:hypothetical protein
VPYLANARFFVLSGAATPGALVIVGVLMISPSIRCATCSTSAEGAVLADSQAI